jgi:hypothetical protein
MPYVKNYIFYTQFVITLTCFDVSRLLNIIKAYIKVHIKGMSSLCLRSKCSTEATLQCHVGYRDIKLTSTWCEPL